MSMIHLFMVDIIKYRGLFIKTVFFPTKEMHIHQQSYNVGLSHRLLIATVKMCSTCEMGLAIL